MAGFQGANHDVGGYLRLYAPCSLVLMHCVGTVRTDAERPLCVPTRSAGTRENRVHFYTEDAGKRGLFPACYAFCRGLSSIMQEKSEVLSGREANFFKKAFEVLVRHF